VIDPVVTGNKEKSGASLYLYNKRKRNSDSKPFKTNPIARNHGWNNAVQPASVLCNGTGEVPTLDNSSDAGYVSCLCYHWTMPMFYLSHKQTRKQRDTVIQYHSVDEYRGSKNAESVSRDKSLKLTIVSSSQNTY